MTTELFWNFIIQTLAILTGAIIGGEIIKRIYSPRVCVKAKKPNELFDGSGCFVSLNIINVGRTVATDCVCYLVIDDGWDKSLLMEREEAVLDENLPTYKEEENDFLFPRDQLITPTKLRELKNIQLCWTHHGNPCVMSINPGVTTSVDICRFQRDGDNWYVLFPTEKGWRRIAFRIRFDRKMILKGKLLICPSNDFAKVLDIKLYLCHDKPTLLVTERFMTRWKRSRLLKNN